MDQIQRFVFDNADVRGEIVQLNDTYREVLARQDYPLALQKLLGEMLVATSLLVETLKIDGQVSLQVQGKGDVNYVVVSSDQGQNLRGIARWTKDPGEQDFAQIFAGGTFTITITPEKGQRYQGIIAIDQPTLTQCIESYFVQSEQLPTCIQIRLDVENQKAAGLFLQVLPGQAESSADKDNDDFEHLSVLAESIRSDELTSLAFSDVLHRLFHEQDVRLFDANDVQFKCTCSTEKSANALKSIDKAELLSIIAEKGVIEVDCHYCGAQYRFDAVDVEAIHAGTFATKNTVQ